jgi:palmitoyltransferase
VQGHTQGLSPATRSQVRRTYPDDIRPLLMRLPLCREGLGTDDNIWKDMVTLFRAAIPSLERRSFAVWDPSAVDYESTSGALIAQNYPGLWKDLERLNDLVSILRNTLTIGEKAQDLAAECTFDQEIFRLINCCVRVTARGFDGDAGTGDEEKWQWIVNAYKKLLITSLQFLNNLVARNERRKLMLWVALFDNSTEGILAEDADDTTGGQSALGEMPKPPVSTGDILVALGETSKATYDAAQDALHAKRLLANKDQMKPPSRPVSGYVLFVRQHQAETREALGPTATPDSVAKALAARWSILSDKEKTTFNKQYDALAQQYEKEMAAYQDARRLAQAEKDKSDRAHANQVAARIAHIEEQLGDRMKPEGTKVAPMEPPVYNADGAIAFPDEKISTGPRPVAEDDYKMMFTASAGAKILESGKSELMKRLENYPIPPQQAQIASPASPIASPASPVYENRTDEDDVGLDEESEEEESEDEDEYPGSSEDGRGLLTDVPLILGPSEIEVLPMIVMSGIVPPAKSTQAGTTTEETNAIVNMHTVRCHLLLAQDNGKNLLRELLIFVAAWDLREEELYFKFMVKIMEAILVNGLMPYAYHAFRDKSRSKDIISPAQAVIMKLLTNIFRSRAEASKTNPQPSDSYPLRVDVHIVNFIFTEFRQHIIPQTCALIFLQGKIHQNLASPEDFPLNLWDMERMYEGVYQYLEFFAVLTEESIWKDVMAQWEVASELVTLLKELEAAIPKLGPGGTSHGPIPRRPAPHQQNHNYQPPAHNYPPPPAPPQNLKPLPISVERPFDLSPDLANTLPPLPIPPTDANAQPPNTTIFEAETPLAYPEDPQDEPSDFEWRNLKKLTVLVLSSLIWKNRKVQDQVREYGGLEALVGCCRHDEHNPYIREHAIMCLRFAVENNEDNQAVIKDMAGMAAASEQRMPTYAEIPHGKLTHPDQLIPFQVPPVPQEVLDTNGYETFMDGKGQVGLRRKDINVSSGPQKPRPHPKMTAEKAAELMQTALRDLPLGDKILLDKEKKEALAKLDRAFS